MYIRISGWQTFTFRSMTSLVITGWPRWHPGWTWCRFWCWMFQLVRSWRTWAFAPPACLRILCCAILTKKAAIRLIFMNRSWVSFHCSLHISMAGKLNSQHLLFSDFRAKFFAEEVCFLSCSSRKHSFGHFGHIQHKVHVGLF